MSAIKPWGSHGGDEELRAVRVFTTVGHRESAGLVMLDVEVFVCKSGTVDRLTTNTGAVGEVTALDHELWNHTVEDRVEITHIWILGDGQFVEVFNGLGGCGSVKTHHDAADFFLTVFDVEVDLVGNLSVSSKDKGLEEESNGQDKG